MSAITRGVALVTGASSGIGAATAKALAATGTTVVAVGRNADRLGLVVEACRETAPSSEAVLCDLGDEGRATQVVAGAVARHGRLDALVLCAGVPMRRRVSQLTMQEVREVLQLNYLTPVAMALASLPSMLDRRSGTLVFVSSLVGRVGNGGEAAYCATKFALCGFAESASVDLADTGVSVRLVIPGPIDTAMWRVVEGQDPPGYRGTLFPPELVADAIVDSLSDTRVELYVPDLKAIAEMKTSDFQAFRDGMVAALRGDLTMELPPDE